MKKKRTLRQWCTLCGAIAGLGVVLALMGGQRNSPPEVEILFWIGAAVVLAGVVLAAVKVRCPKCGCFLVFQVRNMPKYCPKCGVKLDEDEQ